jgi:hypothetical protein
MKAAAKILRTACRGLLWLAALVSLSGWSGLAQGFAVDGAASVGGSVRLDVGDDGAGEDLASCRVHRVTGLPGSHEFESDFIETIATDPDPATYDPDVMWGLTADLDTKVPYWQRAMYISKSENGGATWAQVAKVDSRYFDAEIGEGLRNGMIVSPGGRDFVITTQRGAFQVFPGPNPTQSVVRQIEGPRVPDSPTELMVTKKPGEPIRGNIVEMTSDGERLFVGYGYFDHEPQLFSYRKGGDGAWVEDRLIEHLPSQMDLLSLQFDDPKSADPTFMYVGTGDQVYLFNLRTGVWTRVAGVGADSAIHGMSVVGGLHLAACWGVYNPSGPGTVRRAVNAKFLLHRSSDEAGPNLRAYSIEVDALRMNREVVTSISGVYVSEDSGESWRRLNDLPDGEYRSAHFDSDGSILISGMPGTFLVNPFSDACVPHLKRR